MTDTDSEVLDKFLKAKKDDHYNFEKSIDYKASSGSLQLDLNLSGGFGPGLHRFVGMNEGGKTSAALEVMKKTLKVFISKRKVVFLTKWWLDLALNLYMMPKSG